MAIKNRLSSLGAIAARLRQRTVERRETAGELWRRLATSVAEGGEMSADELEALEQAGRDLGIDDAASAFTADVSALQTAANLEQQLAAYDRPSHPARVEAARERLKAAEAEVAAARGALNSLRHESEAAGHVSISRQQLLANHRRVFSTSTGGN